jgi:hypothetical protein
VLSKSIDLVLAHEAVGKLPQKNPSRNYIKNLRRLGCAFVEKVLCKQLAYRLYCNLRNTGISVEVRAELLPADAPDKPSRAIYIYYPSLYSGSHNARGVVKIHCSMLSAALHPI